MNRQVSLCRFVLNGDPVEVAVPHHWTLLEAVRYVVGLTGTKQGCDSGECGACTVRVDGAAQLSCLSLALHADGCRVDTVEGLAQPAGAHPLQTAFDEAGAAQCGFCTPGMLMSSAAFLESYESAEPPSRTEIAHALGGNLCRCTGYVKIVDAVEAAWVAMDARKQEQP